ncbi:hypothetical protein KY366_08050 [Candidatus Woesearchaeota archaeon]|nr:hypothetical protein [Candidatus Woesearchaeota archaeon]
MAKLDKEELEKLTPLERLKRLKDLQKENEKEIKEAEKLITETKTRIENDNLAESVKVPELKPVDIESLFRDESSLENTVQGAPEQSEEESQLYLLAQAYEEAREMYQSEGPLNEEQLEWIDRLGEKVEKASYETFTKELADLVVATKSLVHKIRKYHQHDIIPT